MSLGLLHCWLLCIRAEASPLGYYFPNAVPLNFLAPNLFYAFVRLAQ